MNIDDYVTIPEAEKKTGLPRTTLQAALYSKRLPGIKLNGKCWLIRKSDIKRIYPEVNI
jgi:excisionase family DNA binding protein